MPPYPLRGIEGRGKLCRAANWATHFMRFCKTGLPIHYTATVAGFLKWSVLGPMSNAVYNRRQINPLKPNFLKQSPLVENITHCYDWTSITILNLNYFFFFLKSGFSDWQFFLPVGFRGVNEMCLLGPVVVLVNLCFTSLFGTNCLLSDIVIRLKSCSQLMRWMMYRWWWCEGGGDRA